MGDRVNVSMWEGVGYACGRVGGNVCVEEVDVGRVCETECV